MLGWFEFALLLLKLANKIVGWLHDRGMINEGRRQVLAEYAARIADKVKVRDEIRKQVDAMSDEELDKSLTDLVGPAGVGGAAPRVSTGGTDGGPGR